MTQHTQQRVDLHYRLATPTGVSATTQERTWFFDLPGENNNQRSWEELLHRLFYDANRKLRAQEPNDPNWLSLDRFTVSPVDASVMISWDGATTKESAQRYLPWILAHFGIVWEFSACYFVDDRGAYDGMTGYDFSELVLYRAMERGEIAATAGRTFLHRLYPKGNPDAYFEDRETRYKNLLGVRPVNAFRKTPGSLPWVSGPVSL
jgi:hypothetical protein